MKGDEDMSPKSEHKRIQLNKNESGQIDYCEDCDVVELAIGAVSVRLHAADLQLFSALVREAVIRLDYYNLDKVEYLNGHMKVGGIH